MGNVMTTSLETLSPRGKRKKKQYGALYNSDPTSSIETPKSVSSFRSSDSMNTPRSNVETQTVTAGSSCSSLSSNSSYCAPNYEVDYIMDYPPPRRIYYSRKGLEA